MVLLPFAQPSAHELRADLEGVADALEGEQHAAVPRLEPLLRLLEQLVNQPEVVSEFGCR